MQLDKKQAEKHIKLLTGSSLTPMTFQTFLDKKIERKNGNEKQSDPLAKIYHGTIDKIWPLLIEDNQKGAGIFICINATDFNGRKEKNIVQVRAFFSDDDSGRGVVIQPNTFEIQSSSGPHSYLVLNEKIPIGCFKPIQKRIARKLGTDSSINDPGRVMRLAGTLHLKNPEKPYLVQIKAISGKKFSLAEVENLFPVEAKASKNSNQTFIGSTVDFNTFANNLPIAEGCLNSNGGRNSTLVILVSEGLGRGMTKEKLESFVLDYCNRSGLDTEEGVEILDRLSAKHDINPFSSRQKNKIEYKKTAEEFCKSRLGDGNKITAILQSDELFEYCNGYFKKNKKSILRNELMQELQNKFPDINSTTLNNIQLHCEGLLYNRNPYEYGKYIGTKYIMKYFITLNNNVLLLNELSEIEKMKSVNHSPEFFTLTKLPYDYDKNATCEIFDKILCDTFTGQVEHIDFIYEWLGYNLIHSTQFGKALIMVGEGANGKSVIATVLMQLVGKDNCSTVSLEAFDQRRTFVIASTEGMLANICPDANEIDKVSEGMLKSYITGESITVEKKNRDPKTIIPTARITVTCNEVPRMSDSSDGLMRRLIILPFENQILDESKQDARFIDPNWWISSGELPGILNKSLAGLERLMKRGCFIEPKFARIYKDKFRNESNSARQFLNDNYEQGDVNEFVFCNDIYPEYRQYCEENGYRPFSASKIYKEVQRFLKILSEVKICGKILNDLGVEAVLFLVYVKS